MAELSSILLWAVGFLWAFWCAYVLVMGIYRAHLSQRLVGLNKVLALPVVGFGYLMDVAANLKRKYGMSDAQLAENQERIRARGAELGFSFDFNARSRTWNTFDAHRLLHWAALEAPQRQLPLKRALLVANFSEGRDIGNHEVLAEVAAGVGMDAARAREVLASGAFANEVREAEEFFRRNGINSVPAVIIEKKHLVSGGQPPEVFERALREIAAAP